jgi:hypothetical protein
MLGTHYIRCDNLSAHGKQFIVMNEFKANHSDGLRLPLVSDPGWLYDLLDPTYRWRSTDHIYSMLSLADDVHKNTYMNRIGISAPATRIA